MDPEKTTNSPFSHHQGVSLEQDSGSEQDAAAYGIKEGALLRKLDRHLLPGVCILYLLSFLDRSNVANAKLDGLDKDLHMTGDQYALLRTHECNAWLRHVLTLQLIAIGT